MSSRERLDVSSNADHDAPARHVVKNKDRDDDEVAYSEGTTIEKNHVALPGPQDHDLPRTYTDAAMKKSDLADTERVSTTSADQFDEGNARAYSHSSYYSRYRVFVHLFIWLFFTG